MKMKELKMEQLNIIVQKDVQKMQKVIQKKIINVWQSANILIFIIIKMNVLINVHQIISQSQMEMNIFVY